MFHLAGRIAFRMDIGNLFQLERALEGNRIIDAAAEIKEILAVHELTR